ncbi:aminotransferase A [Bacillus sp. AFS055030]|uniref:aminotransferase A n=1 Tax=Bacillus sp. AFS055030 TaxID=2033507 RepID=UPI000BFB565B|nr:aminotransferase A [Bacillus sp. AFS055030]PGL70194.1 aromatic amino acid aminotransferase [Bacillus sp. AFS055030]
MENLLNKSVTALQVPGIRKFFNMVVDYPDAINLTLGQPDFPTPEHIKEAGISAIKQNYTAYTENAGLLSLRKAASDFLYKKYNLSYDAAREIIVTNGATEALDSAFRTILREGDEVLLPAPIYPGYEPLIEMCGAIPVYIDVTQNNFKINAELIKRHMTEKTRCLVLCSPSNPLGSVLDYEDLKKIALLLRERDIFVVSDEIYSELTYDKNHYSIASLPGMWEKTIVINGLAKSHSMTGWRIGFTFAPAYISEQMLKVHLYNSVCASTISQYAAIEALTNGINDANQMVVEYRQRRDYVCERLMNMGFEVIKPEGAFYVFPSIKNTNMKSFQFALKLLQEAKVAVVPGDGFSKYGEGYVRISYAASMEMLEKALDRMEQFMQSNFNRKKAVEEV